MKHCTFSTNFRIADLFNLDYVVHFHIPEKELSSPVFTIKVLAVHIFGCYNADNESIAWQSFTCK